MKKLAIFSAPKPFTDPHVAVIQRNAIASWKHMGADVEVLLVGEESGLAEAAAELGVRHLTRVERNKKGTPLVSSVFELARNASSAEIMMFTNADMLYLPETLESVAHAKSQAADFVLLGQRYDLDVREALTFAADWPAKLRADVNSHGKLHPQGGSDYFIFPRHLFTDIPPFAIGRAGWDNWMIHHATTHPWLAIDATHDFLAIHQNHDYAHLPGERGHQRNEESTENTEIAGGMRTMYTLLDVEHRLVNGRIQRASASPARWLRAIERGLQPDEAVARGVRRPLLRAVRKLRRALIRMGVS
jgi:hypothetical protein